MWHPIPLIYNDEGPAGSGQSYSEDCRERIYMALPIGYLDHSPRTYSGYYYKLNELNFCNEVPELSMIIALPGCNQPQILQ